DRAQVPTKDALPGQCGIVAIRIVGIDDELRNGADRQPVGAAQEHEALTVVIAAIHTSTAVDLGNEDHFLHTGPGIKVNTRRYDGLDASFVRGIHCEVIPGGPAVGRAQDANGRRGWREPREVAERPGAGINGVSSVIERTELDRADR